MIHVLMVRYPCEQSRKVCGVAMCHFLLCDNRSCRLAATLTHGSEAYRGATPLRGMQDQQVLSFIGPVMQWQRPFVEFEQLPLDLAA